MRCRAATSPPGMWPGRLLRLRHTPAPGEGVSQGLPSPVPAPAPPSINLGKGLGDLAAAERAGTSLLLWEWGPNWSQTGLRTVAPICRSPEDWVRVSPQLPSAQTRGEQHRLGTGSHRGGRVAPCERAGLQTGAARSVPCPTPHRAQRAAPGWSRAEARFRLCSDRSALIYGAGARRTRSTPPCLFLILFPGSLVSFSADLSNAPTILRVPRCLESSQLEFAILGPKT